jgi:hypothetical protein
LLSRSRCSASENRLRACIETLRTVPGVNQIMASNARGFCGCPDRNFGLPTAVFGVMVGCYLGFLGIMAVAFSSPMLAIPMVIFAVAIIAGFAVPTIWTRLRDNASAPATPGEFAAKGVMTNTGPLEPRDAIIQVLTLPVLVVVWGIIALVIAAIVR